LYIHGNHNIRFKNYAFIVLAVYDLKLIHSSFLRCTIKNLFIRRFRSM
ncbi:unnamed protein product, partial [Rotaria magnacalcarata]